MCTCNILTLFSSTGTSVSRQGLPFSHVKSQFFALCQLLKAVNCAQVARVTVVIVMNNFHNWLDVSRERQRGRERVLAWKISEWWRMKCHEPRQLFTGRTFKHVELNIYAHREKERERAHISPSSFWSSWIYFVIFYSFSLSHTHLTRWRCAFGTATNALLCSRVFCNFGTSRLLFSQSIGGIHQLKQKSLLSIASVLFLSLSLSPSLTHALTHSPLMNEETKVETIKL